MAQRLGQCERCGDGNPYTSTVCSSCGGRLPWADALDADRRQRVAAQQAAAQAQQAAQQAQQAAARAQQQVVHNAQQTTWQASSPQQTSDKSARWVIGSIIFLIFIIGRFGCSSSSTEGGDDSSSHETSAQSQSKANAYAKQVQANLDTTTLEQFTAQMPSNMQPDIERSGENRTFTWTFDDGSKIIATFRPKGGEGSGQGLVLYMVDIT